MLADGLKYDSEGKRWTVPYPWIKEPGNLPDNVYAAVARMKSAEAAKKLGHEYTKMYNEQIRDMVERGVARLSSWTTEIIRRPRAPHSSP